MAKEVEQFINEYGRPITITTAYDKKCSPHGIADFAVITIESPDTHAEWLITPLEAKKLLLSLGKTLGASVDLMPEPYGL